METNNSIYLRRRNKILIPVHIGPRTMPLPKNCAITLSKNLEGLGYGMSPELIENVRKISSEERLLKFYQELTEILKTARGAKRKFKPMYPNFPQQVMDMSECELYFNAIIHYWSGGNLLPHTEKVERFPLLDEVELTQIELGTQKEFESLFGQIIGSNTSLSIQDKEDVAWFVESFKDNVEKLIPENIPQKENLAYLSGLLLTNGIANAESIIARFIKGATDVLRLATALSGGDVSLAQPVKFKSFARAERRLLLSLINGLSNPTEDMLRRKETWKAFGFRLNPKKNAKRFPVAAESFAILRNDTPFETFNSKVEKSLLISDNKKNIVTLLKTRPGDFARRLDHLLRLQDGTPFSTPNVLDAFAGVASTISTPVLLQVRQHFINRQNPQDIRVFLPKGNIAKAQGIEFNLPPINVSTSISVVTAIDKALRDRFKKLPSLGNVYIDTNLKNFLLPFSQRSASKSMRTIVRGSKVDLTSADTLRMFVWWRDGEYRTDIDLSASLFDDNFESMGDVAFYDLKRDGSHHSGDITSAPNGASEFIDVSISQLLKSGASYVAMMLNSYTRQPYCDLPECFGGFMAREHANSGEIYDPRTVQNRFDLTADTIIAMPIIFDLENRKAIWVDLALKSHPGYVNAVACNITGIQLMLKSFVDLRKPNVYDLLELHAKSRGKIVKTVEEADEVFSVENETPFQLERLASEFMA